MQGPFESSGNNLDLARLMLAILVIFSHSWGLVPTKGSQEPMEWLSHGQTNLGRIAVFSFFIISGFLITNSFLRSKSLWSYLKKRVARIYPGYLVCMLLSAAVVIPISGAQLIPQGTIPKVLSFVLSLLTLREFAYTNAFSGNPSHFINGSIWSISWEFLCYLFVALLGLTGLLRRRRIVFVMFLTLLAICEAIRLTIRETSQVPHFLSRLDFCLPPEAMYLAGMVFFLFKDKIPLKTSLSVASICALAGACFVPGAFDPTFAFAGTYLVFWFGFHPRLRMHHAARFGDFSYGTYLYAFPIQQLITMKFATYLGPCSLFLMATPFTFVAAVLSWYLVERRFLSRTRRVGIDAPIVALPQ